MTTQVPLLEVRHLSKTFPGVKALSGVDLSVHSGEVVALLGHNGSGKSTLVKILAGVYKPDEGGGISFPDIERGSHDRLHFIHQDLGLVPMLTTVENLVLGRPVTGSSLMPAPRRRERREARRVINEFGVDFDVELPVSFLTPAQRTIVAIVRALHGWNDAHNVLVLDEPTAALHGREAEALFDVVRQVASRGAGVVYISHRLDEVVKLADRVIVLKNGEVVASRLRGEFDHDALVHLIAGAEPDPNGATEARDAVTVKLEALDLCGPGFTGVDLQVRAGEIVGVAGLVGSGAEHICSSIFGTAPRTGHVTVDQVEISAGKPAAAIRAGVGFVPADRRRLGAVVTMSARENLTLPRLRPLVNGRGAVDRRRENADARAWFSKVDVRPALPDRPFALFSGGNQQKIVIAKWLRNEPDVLLLDEPTQGVDVGAKAGIYELITEAASAGAAVLIGSSDTKELAELCDRVIVIRDGRKATELAGAQLTETDLVRAVISSTTTSATTSSPGTTSHGATT